MGCCQSSKSQLEMENHRPESESHCGGTGAPPLPVEEESVKEVLSETTVVKNERMQELKMESQDVIVPKLSEEIVSEASAVSDLGSFTESFSTTGMENRDDDDGEVNQSAPGRAARRRKNGVEFRGRGIGRDRQAPTRRKAAIQQNREQGAVSRQFQGRVSPVQRRNAGVEKKIRQDSGESSGRRLGSRATSGEVGQRGSMRSKSPGVSENGRPGSDSMLNMEDNSGDAGKAEKSDRPGGALMVKTAENGGDDGKAEKSDRPGGALMVKTAENGGDGGKLEKSNDVVSPEDGESLENPIVSLECFIFL